MKQLIFTFVIASMAFLSTAVVADEPTTPRENQDKVEQQNRRRPAGPPRDPAKWIDRIMTKFDTDGDEKLDRAELTAWLKAMQQRRGQFLRGDRPGRGKIGPQGKRRRGSDQSGTPGGDQPNRPPAGDR